MNESYTLIKTQTLKDIADTTRNAVGFTSSIKMNEIPEKISLLNIGYYIDYLNKGKNLIKIQKNLM